MAFSNRSRRPGIVAEINVTPLTDVFLVPPDHLQITASAERRPQGVDPPRRTPNRAKGVSHDDAVHEIS
jgi:biopolymer transport protein ExbD